MANSRRPAGISFTLRLLTVLLVPLLGLGVLAIQRIDDERTTATTALFLVDEALRQQAAAAVYGPAQLERIALEGLASIDELGFPRDVVVAVTGVDLEATYNGNAVELDGALDRLGNEHGDFVLDDGTRLGTRLDAVRSDLAAQRELSAVRRAEHDAIHRVFAELNLLLADAIDATAPTVENTAALGTTSRPDLAALRDVVVAAGVRGEALLDGLLNQSDVTKMALSSASSRLDFAIARYSTLVDVERMRAFP